MKNLIVIFSLVVVLAACDRKKENTDVTALTVYQEAMKIHDELMPRMDEMYNLERKLKTLRDSLGADSLNNSGKIAGINEKLSALEAANKDMMDWMHHVQDVPGAAPAGQEHHAGHKSGNKENPEDMLKVQQEQKRRIEEVKAAMEKSIEEASRILAN